jgi:hypothetical protein
MGGRGIRDWLVGRREFRVLVEIDHGRAVDHGGRPVAGTDFVEFVHVGTGEKHTAQRAAFRSFRDRLATELPEATVRAVVEREADREPEPRFVGRGRRLLLLAGEESDAEMERQLDRVVAAWRLPPDRYRLHTPLADREWWMRLLSCFAGIVAGGPFTIQLLHRAVSAAPDAAFLARLVQGDNRWLTAAIVLAVLPLACVPTRFAVLASWPVQGRWIASGFALGPAVLVGVVAAVFDGGGWLVERFPVPAAILLGLVGIGAAPVLALTVQGPVWRAGIGWGLPLLAGGISVFAGDMVYALYLDRFGLSRPDVSVTYFHQWALGASVTLLLLLGIYPGLAFWAVGRRFIGISAIGMVMNGLVTIVYLLSVALIVVLSVEQRAEIDENGLPDELIGLEPRLACVTAVAEPYSYVGQPVEAASGSIVYFGRADGRLAVWHAQSGGVLLDGQAVGLRFVQPGSTCG